MTKPIILLSANPYNFKDDTGVQRNGISIQYITSDVLDGSDGLFGHQVVKMSIPSGVKLNGVPAMYTPLFSERHTSKGIKLAIVGLDYIKPVKIQF